MGFVLLLKQFVQMLAGFVELSLRNKKYDFVAALKHNVAVWRYAFLSSLNCYNKSVPSPLNLFDFFTVEVASRGNDVGFYYLFTA